MNLVPLRRRDLKRRVRELKTHVAELSRDLQAAQRCNEALTEQLRSLRERNGV